MNEIVVDGLTKDYGSGRGVFDVSFKINKGEVYGFLGPNGAGKSTTIRHLMGFSQPDKGKTQILGQDSFENYYYFMEKEKEDLIIKRTNLTNYSENIYIK